MAKVGFWLKGARGKLAGSVLANTPSGTIIRENKVGANPRTMSQAVQRACFATAAKTSVALKAVVESAFDGAKNGEESRRAFLAIAVESLKAQYRDGSKVVHLLEKNATKQVPNILQVSKGSLGAINLNKGYTSDDKKDYLTIVSIEHAGSAVGITFGQLRAKYPMIKPGSQLTFVWGENVENDVPETFRWKYARLVISPNIKDTDYIIDANEVSIPAAAIVISKTEGFDKLGEDGSILLGDTTYMAIQGTETNLSWSFYNDANINGQAMIVSNYENGEWLHTSSFTQCKESYDNTSAIESYMNVAKVSAANSDYYTEQAEPVEEGNVSYDSLNQALQGVIRSQGYQPKSLNLESSNTYGPIPEGNIVEITLNENPDVWVQSNTIKVKSGETAIANAWVRRINSSMVAISFPVEFGTAQSITASITFDLHVPGGSWENMGFRATIQKVQG